jgi:hypothetical protein
VLPSLPPFPTTSVFHSAMVHFKFSVNIYENPLQAAVWNSEVLRVRDEN